MTYNVEQHIALARVSDLAASPCGTWLAVAVQRLDRDGAEYTNFKTQPVRHWDHWLHENADMADTHLIVHGERDYRCPINEGLNLFEALQYHGVESELLVFPDQNRWILKPRNIAAWYEAVLEFIGRHFQR